MAQEEFQELNLSEVMGERFGRYSKYIIQERAIPDVRDGLKPVQRRIIYAMYHDGNTYDKAYRKSAKTVGNVIGNYHPHGDSSVYDAMIRLSQDWKMRQPLIDMQGNNGSMDGDPAAAMRYTEARLSKIANQLTEDLDKDTVDWILNFDDTEEEPTVLPARYPNLLVNGATGISAGYATDIPPHNLGEVIDATIYLMKHPQASLAKLMDHIKGPDFPTGGIIQGKDGLIDAYKTGKGRVVVRAKTEVEDLRGGKQRIVIHEIPYEVNKASMIQQIDDIRINREIEGIAEVRDETDKDGLRVAIDLRKDASAEGILTYLLKHTDMQVNYNFNMVAINDKRPDQMGLAAILSAYIKHRRQIVTRRTQYLLKKAQDRQHIVEGLIRALSILDEVIATIRKSENKRDAKDNLMAKYDFSERQAEAIVSLQLYRLSNTDVKDLEKEAQDLDEKISYYELVLNNPDELDKLITAELRETKKQFATDRRTVIEEEIESLKVEKEVLIADEDVVVTVTKEGYLKRSSTRSFAASDIADFGQRDNDYAIFAREMSTLDQLVLFTNYGNAINRPVYSLPDLKWKDMGRHISQDISLEDGEKIIKAFGLAEFDESLSFIFASRKGYIKRTLASDFAPKKTFKSTAYRAINLDGDELINVMMAPTDAVYDVFVVTHQSYGLRYELDEVNLVGPAAKGVRSINLKDDDYVVASQIFDPFEDIQDVLVLSQRGSIKKMNLVEFDKTSRNKRGLKVYKTLKNQPHEPVLLIPVRDNDEEITIVTNIGKQAQVQARDYHAVDRQNNGTFIFQEATDGSPQDFQYPVLERLEKTMN